MTTLQNHPLARGVFIVSTFLFFASLAAACGGPVQQVCEAECECEACSDDAYDTCVDTGKKVEERSEDTGCTREFEAYSACAETNYSCFNGNFDIGCGSEEFTLTACLEGTNTGGSSSGGGF
jgi:hypothetical protein